MTDTDGVVAEQPAANGAHPAEATVVAFASLASTVPHDDSAMRSLALVLAEYDHDPRLRTQVSMRISALILELHANALNENFAGDASAAELTHNDVSVAYSQFSATGVKDALRLTLSTFFTSIGLGGIFSLQTTAEAARPEGLLSIAYLLAGVGLIMFAFWVVPAFGTPLIARFKKWRSS